jgi:DNA-nicking Smr family endonuclease
MAKQPKNTPSPDDLSLFYEAVRDAVPLAKDGRNLPAPPPAPLVPVQTLLDEHDALFEALIEPLDWEQGLETGEELSYLRDGLSRQVLKKLRRGHWIVQDHIDLHGLNREEARESLGRFLAHCLRRGLRCVRIVHGKGLSSKNREPVLKAKVRVWLMHRDEVLAYCQAPAAQGGSGALLVLLKA